jgi:UDP-perosamine 4-acetyltransferase
MADELIIFGSGGHAKVMVEAVLARSPQRRIVLVDDDPEAAGKTVLGISVAGGRDWLSANLPDAAVALGIGNNRARATLADELTAAGRRLETVIHPAAIVGASVRVQEGAFIAAGAILIADARIGRAAIVNTAASVDHDCEIGDGAHIGPGARLCGNVRVGKRTLIGVGSAVRPGITIGSDVIVGAGSAVVGELEDGGTYAGCPAQPLGRTPRA